LYEWHAIVGNLIAITFNPIASAIWKKVQIKICEVDALPAPFRLAQQLAWIV
jgi:hypothetical protein